MSLGWCMLPVFDRRGNQLSGGVKATMTGGGVRGDTVRLALYESSPRMLLSIEHPIAGECMCSKYGVCINYCTGFSPGLSYIKAERWVWSGRSL